MAALSPRPATERIIGFYEYAHHLLDVDAALKFGKAITEFHGGRVIIGQCPGARLAVPGYEAAFALSRLMDERGESGRTRITIVSAGEPGLQTDDPDVNVEIGKALAAHRIEFLPDFPIESTAAVTMLIPLAAGIDPTPSTAILIAISASLGIPFVISTPPNAMVYGEGGITFADLAIPGLILMILGCILVSTTGPMVLKLVGIP